MSTARRQVVELQPAYAFICDECGAESFVRSQPPHLTDDELAELREDHGVEPWETGDFTTMPSEVTCGSCGHTFATEPYGESDEE